MTSVGTSVVSIGTRGNRAAGAVSIVVDVGQAPFRGWNAVGPRVRSEASRRRAAR
jgi:hypothetical protein